LSEDVLHLPEIASLDREALAAVAQTHGLDLVVLFGSTARGQRRPASDLDIAVHFAGPRQDPPTLPEEARVEGSLLDLLGLRCDLDMVVLNDASPLLRWNVARHGIPLFAGSPTRWTLFQIRAHRDYEDSARFRAHQWRVLLQRLGHDTAGR
jgi:predicted nucleotidyltransferase